MKKVLALVLAVMMLFGSMSINASAAVTDYKPSEASIAKYTSLKKAGVIKSDQAILAFDAQNGTFYGELNVYDSKEETGFRTETGVTGVYYMIPDNLGSFNTNLVPGRYVILPQVIAPTGKVFDGWYSYYDDAIFSAGSKYIIPGDSNVGAEDTFKGVLEFVAFYSPAPVEKDIFATIITTLVGLVAGLIAPLIGMEEEELVALVSGLFN